MSREAGAGGGKQLLSLAAFSGLLVRFCRGCSLLLIMLGAVQQPASSKEISAAAGGSNYSEAIRLIQQHAIFIGPKTARQEIAGRSIKAYLREKDPFSDYLTAEEYANFKRTQKGNYVGVGADIERGPGGTVLGFPIPGSPAQRAGMVAGDRLERINGRSVQGLSLFTVAAMTRGREGTRLSLTVRSGNGPERKLTVARSRLKGESVSLHPDADFTVIRISTFTPKTPVELERAIKKASGAKPLVLDLRSNRGGDLVGAVDSARIFLKKGSRVSSIRMRSGLKSHNASADGTDIRSRIYLWQDEATASAAELFMAALTDNRRAVSIGKRSYGKGSRQDVIAMSDGSALVLTTGYLQSPAGLTFNGKGLEPGYPLPGKPTTAEYSAQTKRLIQQAPRK